MVKLLKMDIINSFYYLRSIIHDIYDLLPKTSTYLINVHYYNNLPLLFLISMNATTPVIKTKKTIATVINVFI